jgi:hypothetical protein
MSDAYVRQQRSKRRARARAQPAPDELEQPRAPLITQGVRSRAAPIGHKPSADELIRAGRPRLGGGGWTRLF